MWTQTSITTFRSGLARLVGLSEGHLHRAFRKSKGETRLQFITGRRVHRAMQLLTDNLTVLEVTFAVGFQSPSHFARIFRIATDKTPSEFRRDLVA